jgi:hypothetical protein
MVRKFFLDTARLGFSVWSKKTIVAIIAIVIVCAVGIYSYNNISDFSCLGCIKDNITSKDSNNSEVTFNVKNGDRIKFICDSSIKKGTLKITLTDSNGKLIKNFQTNKNYTEQISLVKKGKYILSATYDNFIGNYTVKYK